MDALVAVNRLGDVQVGLQAAQHVGVGGAAVLVFGEIRPDLMSRSAPPSGVVEILVEAVGVQCVVCRARGLLSFMSLAPVKRKVPRQRRLERRQCSTSLSPCSPWPSVEKQAAPGEHRQVRPWCRPGSVVVDVAAEGARLDRAARAPFRRRRGVPMMPKNGFSSISRPHGMVQTPRLESIGMWVRR